MLRTSNSHPLRIDELAVPGTSAVIGLSFCPGKCQRQAASGAWARDLDTDLAAIADWGAAAIINLVEDHEMRELGVADTAQRLPAGIDYYHLPIPDAGTPDAQWEVAWAVHGAAVRARLGAGQRILVHCKGGLGRTGLLAARLLIEFGMAPGQAVSAVRAARAGAIETDAQQAYVLLQQPPCAVPEAGEELGRKTGDRTQKVQMASTTPLFCELWDKAELRRAYAPVISHPNKQLLYDIAYAPGEVEHGEVCVSRWPCAAPAGVACGNALQLSSEPGFFSYRSSPGVVPQQEWHLNFADPDLFYAYGGALFAQDEMQVAEHPLLASVRQKLLSVARQSDRHEPRTRDRAGRPTPVLVQGVERRIAVAIDANAAQGLYGNRFARAAPDAIVRASLRIEPPTLSNLLAIAAPACGGGIYRHETIDDALHTAYSGFRAIVQSCSAAGSAPARPRLHSGNWGCGAFGGNPELMYLVQMIAADWTGLDAIVFHAPVAEAFVLACAKFASLQERLS
ncbi:MAG: hypothetical protein KBG75_10285, partial [Pseudomonadales bacterium]|nr:hypothetical protein [Pseudomonadales bacterium]